MSMTKYLTGLVVKPGLIAKWCHERKIDKNMAKGYRLATEDDVVGSDLTAGELTLIVREDSVPIVEPVVEVVAEPPKKEKKPTYKHKLGYKLSWCHPEQLAAKTTKGYHVVAFGELVGQEDSNIDAVTHNGHLLLAKGAV